MTSSKGALAFDPGQARVGLAKSDSGRSFCFEVASIARSHFEDPQRIRSAVAEALSLEKDELAEWYDVAYVGLPISLSGAFTNSTHQAIQFAKAIQSSTGLLVRLIDERLTTSSASARLRQAGKSAKNQRNVIDSIAALIILEQALELERRGPGLAGVSIEEAEANG